MIKSHLFIGIALFTSASASAAVCDNYKLQIRNDGKSAIRVDVITVGAAGTISCGTPGTAPSAMNPTPPFRIATAATQTERSWAVPYDCTTATYDVQVLYTVLATGARLCETDNVTTSAPLVTVAW